MIVDSIDHISKLTCNICSRTVEGIAYRTSCLHFFCPSCSQQAFSAGCRCPICSISLSNSEVHEIIVGITSPVDSADAVFQLVLQNCNWSSLLENERLFSLSLIELHSFVTIQLALASKKDYSTKKALQEESLSVKQERVSSYLVVPSN